MVRCALSEARVLRDVSKAQKSQLPLGPWRSRRAPAFFENLESRYCECAVRHGRRSHSKSLRTSHALRQNSPDLRQNPTDFCRPGGAPHAGQSRWTALWARQNLGLLSHKVDFDLPPPSDKTPGQELTLQSAPIGRSCRSRGPLLHFSVRAYSQAARGVAQLG